MIGVSIESINHNYISFWEV